MNAEAAYVEQVPASGWLRSLHDWPIAAIDAIRRHGAVARILVATVRGSAPREVGTCMLVEREQIIGTIGGGKLEWFAIETARQLLDADTAATVRIDKLVLGTELAQCCGGVVELWIERFGRTDLRLLRDVARAMPQGDRRLLATMRDGQVVRRLSLNSASSKHRVRLSRAHDFDELDERLDDPAPNLWLYGAGHVAQALVRVLAELSIRITWIDSRAALLPAKLPSNVETLHSDDPASTVSAAPPGTHFLVMTHSHSLDYALCRAVLERGDHQSAGVIGSSSKAARFRSRLASDGLSREQIARLHCPIGIDGVNGKAPGVIAIAVAAQLLKLLEVAPSIPRPLNSALATCNGECKTCDVSQRDAT